MHRPTGTLDRATCQLGPGQRLLPTGTKARASLAGPALLRGLCSYSSTFFHWRSPDTRTGPCVLTGHPTDSLAGKRLTKSWLCRGSRPGLTCARPHVTTEHLKCSYSKFRCAVSIKHTGFPRLSVGKKAIKSLINIVYIGYILK